jgi:DNA polymerase-1
MRAPSDVVTIDFETDAIERRPKYPPRPVGVSIIYPGKKPVYRAWAHPEGNNTDFATVKRELRDIDRSGAPVLFHNAKFDVDVAQTHCGMKLSDWRRIHDTMYLLFLDDPHSKTLSLKPSAERLLGMVPAERDAVSEWLVQQRIIRRNQKDAGAYISLAPGDLVGEYANGDTLRTLKLFKMLFPQITANGMGAAYDRERELMPILLENERRGVRIDVALLEHDIGVYRKAMQVVEQWLRKELTRLGASASDLNFDSDRDVAAALRDSGVVTDFVQTATGQDSVSKKNLTPGMFNDARIASALGYRNRLFTCLGTFMEPWLAMASANGGFIHTNWNQVRQMSDSGSGAGARTGRMSCSPNFMNIPKSFEDKGDGYVHPRHLRALPELPRIRKYVLADDHRSVFLHRDFNQQELRILGHYEDGRLMEAYQQQPRLDVHDFVRDLIKDVANVTLERRAVKILNFGMIYGMGAGALAAGLGCSVQEAREIRGLHQKALPDVKRLEESIKRGAKADQPIRTWGGRVYYTEPPIMHNGRMLHFEYKLLNYLIQGSAADCTKQAVINYHHARKEGRFLVTVHDEINISAPTKAHKSEMRILREAMCDVDFDVPMASDGKFGPSWGSLSKFEEK